MDMLEHLRSILQRKCGLDAGRPVLLGFSGGPDSLCLLDCLQHLGYPLILAHLDHRLRPESGEEARAAQALAEARGLPIILDSVEVKAYADQQGLSIEEAARTQRYRFLFRAAAIEGAQAVAVGHNADDQVETLMMHLLRGAGLDGLKGMPFRSLPNAWSEEIPLVRPLLGVWREQIMAYLRQAGLEPLQDASNLDITFFRNRLRHELIPTLESYNPQARDLIWRTADILGEDQRLLEELTQSAWNACTLEVGAGFVAFDYNALGTQPPGLQRRLVRRAIARLRPGLRDIDYAAVARALEFMTTPSNIGQVDLIAGLRLLKEGERLWLAAWEADLPHQDWPQLPPGAELSLEVPGRLDLPGGWVLGARLITQIESGRGQALDNADPFQAWLDLDQLRLPLEVRARRPGDRLRPLGMGGNSMKLAEFMVNRKLPRRARDHWPLVLSGDEIAWVPGLQIGHSFRLTPKVCKIAHLRLKVK